MPADSTDDKISLPDLVATRFVWGNIFIMIVQFHFVLQSKLLVVIIGPG